MPGNEYIIIDIAITTLVIVIVAAVVLRGGVAKSKGDPTRSAFTETLGEAARKSQPGTEREPSFCSGVASEG